MFCRESEHFYGTGESFLFTCRPRWNLYSWAGDNQVLERWRMVVMIIHDGDDDALCQCRRSKHCLPQNETFAISHLDNQILPRCCSANIPLIAILRTTSWYVLAISLLHEDSFLKSKSTQASLNQMFVRSTSCELTVGAGDGRFGIWLDSNLNQVQREKHEDKNKQRTYAGQ